jgi:DNA invertase Pin-like site-specific DNA recombinase
VTRAIAYVRVSTAKQASEGQSLDAQRAKLQAYAQVYDVQIVDVVVDAGASAKDLDRPGLARALARMRAGEADALLVTKLDRLTRSVRDLGHLLEEYFGDRFALLSVGDSVDTRSAAGRLVLNVLASVSQWEREAIGERTSAVMQHMRANGEYTGGRAPWGFRAGPDGLVPDEGEQAVQETARRLRGDGLSLASIGRELAELGHLSRAGKAFAPAQVARMVAA